MKKFFSNLLCFVMLLLTFFVFAGCKKEKIGPIPNGDYMQTGWGETQVFRFVEKDDGGDFFGLKIEGDSVAHYESGSLFYRAKIVERDGKIYFEGYKWKMPFYSWIYGECGDETVYESIYSETEKTITLIVVKVDKYL